jgi:Tol biopolymer transport system component
VAKAKEIESRIALKPQASGPYVQLAQLYEGAGRKDLAIQVLERFQKIEPANRFVATRLDLLRGAASVTGRQVVFRSEEQTRGVAAEQARAKRVMLAVAAVAGLALVVYVARTLLFPSARPLAVGEVSFVRPSWSPKGDRLACLVQDGQGGGKLRVYDRKLAFRDFSPPGFGGYGEFHWSPDGLQLAYEGDAEGEGWGSAVWVLNVTDGTARQVAMGRDPSWSADGRFVAMMCSPRPADVDRGDYEEKLCTANVVTGDTSPVLSRPLREATWQPGGELIAFQVDLEVDRPEGEEDAGGDQAGGDHDREDPASLAEGALAGGAANASEASKGIYSEIERRKRQEEGRGAAGFGYDQPSDIWVVPAFGGGERALTSDGHSSRPRWSPDGSFLVFTFADPASGRRVLQRMAADGTRREPLFAEGPGADDAHDLQLSRDGRRAVLWAPVEGEHMDVAATMTRSPTNDLYLIDVGGGKLRRLANRHPFKQAFSLSPDGRRIAYEAIDKDTGRTGIWTMSP